MKLDRDMQRKVLEACAAIYPQQIDPMALLGHFRRAFAEVSAAGQQPKVNVACSSACFLRSRGQCVESIVLDHDDLPLFAD